MKVKVTVDIDTDDNPKATPKPPPPPKEPLEQAPSPVVRTAIKGVPESEGLGKPPGGEEIKANGTGNSGLTLNNS